MLGWFRPSCPVDAAAKGWIEQSLGWLSNQFESSVFIDKPMILPTPEFFPDSYDRSTDSVQRMLERVCRYMEVDPDKIQLKIFRSARKFDLINEAGDAVSVGPAGTYSRGYETAIIRIGSEQLADPMQLVGTLAHELSHERLMGEERVSGREFDNELLTDLTAVFHGFGIFLANAPRAWRSQMKLWPGTDLKRPEYLSSPMYGYALAHIAWHREQLKPAWTKYLQAGPRANFYQGLGYLRKTEDSECRPFWLKLG